jgi:hypothetical protein
MLLPPAVTSAQHLSNVKCHKCTGPIVYRTADGVGKLQVRMGTRGRGLFAASAFKKGDTITTVAGSLIDNQNPNVAQHTEKYQWSQSHLFVMENAKGALGIFANTAASSGANNARYICNRRNQSMRFCATRTIVAGKEILVPYGRTYVSQIKTAVKLQNDQILENLRSVNVTAPVVVTGGAVARWLCAKCGKRVTKKTRQTHARCCSGAINK